MSGRTSTSSQFVGSPPSSVNVPISPSPGLNSTSGSSARRHALREFYKLQQAGPAQLVNDELVTTEEEHIEDFDANANSGVSESVLDKPGTNVDEYVQSLLKSSSVKSILKTSNSITGELRALDSEQKALVYNNYNKLISASNTLQGLKNKVYSDNDHETIDRLMQSLDNVSKISVSIEDRRKNKSDSVISEEANKSIRQDHAVRWIMLIESTLQNLVRQGQNDEALKQGKRALELLDMWITGYAETSAKEQDNTDKLKQLRTIRQKCASTLSSLG